MAIRILHTADLHLDSPLRSLALKDARLSEQVRIASRRALERMVQFCIDERLHALLIAGDLYDGQARSAKTAAYLALQMERLQAAGVAVFYIKGNHDAENPISGAVALPDNVHVFDGRGGKVQLGDEDIWIHGVSFRDKHAPESLLPRYQAPEPLATNIALMHSSLAGAAGHDPYAPCTVAALKAAGFDYWALGHIHKRQVHSEAPWVVMPGMPQGRDIGEAGPKSATLLTIEGGAITVSEVLTSEVEFQAVACAVDGLESDDALRAALRACLQETAANTRSPAAILRLTLTGSTPHAWHIRRDKDMWQATIEEMAEAAGSLWIEKLSLDITAESASSPEGVNAAQEVQGLMEDIRQEAGFLASAAQELTQIMALLPPDSRRRLIPDEAAETALLEQLTQEAVLSMAARLRGQST